MILSLIRTPEQPVTEAEAHAPVEDLPAVDGIIDPGLPDILQNAEVDYVGDDDIQDVGNGLGPDCKSD